MRVRLNAEKKQSVLVWAWPGSAIDHEYADGSPGGFYLQTGLLLKRLEQCGGSHRGEGTLGVGVCVVGNGEIEAIR